MRYVVETLLSDNGTRQAVMTIWERSPRESKDIPCTVSLQFLIRYDKLHCIANMRSSDCYLGLPYDVFSFSMIATYVRLLTGLRLEMGALHIFHGSLHIYTRDLHKITACIQYGHDLREKIVYDDTQFQSPDHLLSYLESMANAPVI